MTKWFLEIFFCLVDTSQSKNKEPCAGVLSKIGIYGYLYRMDVPWMLWLNPILCGMVQSTAHIRLELVMNEIRKEVNLGRQELILCPSQ